MTDEYPNRLMDGHQHEWIETDPRTRECVLCGFLMGRVGL